MSAWIRGLAALLSVAVAVGTSRPADEVVLGMSAPFSGPAAALGNEMRAGIEAAIAAANRAGGVRGRIVRLVALDDGYEPDRTVPNMRKLVDEERVVAVVGNVGTPTAVAAIPIATQTGTPFVGAYTGAGILRKSPPDHVVINFRASYAEETGAMVDALIDLAGLKPEEVAFFTQRDAYGDAGYAGGIAALKRRGLSSESAVAHGRYERNTDAVENGLAEVMSARTPARAVIMVGAYKPCAAFVRLARANEFKAAFLNVSFVGAGALGEALGAEGDGVIVTQVVPHFASDLPLIVEYRAALAAARPGAVPSCGSLEGYTVMRMVLKGLGTIQSAPDRESMIGALEGLGHFDLGLGAPLSLSPSDHQASNRVWPTVLRAGVVAPATWEELFAPGRAEAK